MPYAIVLYFNKEQDAPIRKLHQILTNKKIISYLPEIAIGPHITLAIYDDLNCDQCEEEIRLLASRSESLEVILSHIGIFNNQQQVVFLAATVTDILLNFHNLVHKTLQNVSKKPWVNYLPGEWIPHCTLAMDLSKASVIEVVKLAQKIPLPITLNTESIGVVEFQPIKNLYSYHFKK